MSHSGPFRDRGRLSGPRSSRLHRPRQGASLEVFADCQGILAQSRSAPDRKVRGGSLSSGISPPDVAGSRRTRDARLRTPDRSAKSHLAVRRSRRQRSYQKPLTPPLPPPRTSPGEDPRRLPERGARALPAPLADLVVRTQGPLAVRVSLDVGVKPEPAPQWLPIHGPTLGVADPAGKGSTARRASTSSPQSPRVGRYGPCGHVPAGATCGLPSLCASSRLKSRLTGPVGRLGAHCSGSISASGLESVKTIT